jgi:RNA polymerase sigma factor (TIGR02999 family)
MADPRSTDDVSGLLVAWAAGDSAALAKLMPLVYHQLKRLARRKLAGERAAHTLQPSDLVNEAYLRLVQHTEAQWRHRTQFMAVASQIMRRILVDHARRSRYQKRGGGAARVVLDDTMLVSEAPAADLVALDEALRNLARHDERKARVVELRYFGGMTVDEIAEHLDVSPVTVKRDWSLARAWLYRAIADLPVE